MAKKIVGIKNNNTDDPNINMDLLETAEEIVDGIKCGDIVSGLFVVVHSDRSSANAFSGIHIDEMLSQSLIVQREIMDTHVILRRDREG